jgi:hypothetical protein
MHQAKKKAAQDSGFFDAYAVQFRKDDAAENDFFEHGGHDRHGKYHGSSGVMRHFADKNGHVVPEQEGRCG